MSTSSSADLTRRVMRSSAWLGLRHAGWMIMRKYDRGGVHGQRLFDHLARINAGAVYRAAEQFLESQHPVPVVEIQAAENLVRSVPEPGHQEGFRIRGAAYGLTDRQGFPQSSGEQAPAMTAIRPAAPRRHRFLRPGCGAPRAITCVSCRNAPTAVATGPAPAPAANPPATALRAVLCPITMRRFHSKVLTEASDAPAVRLVTWTIPVRKENGACQTDCTHRPPQAAKCPKMDRFAGNRTEQRAKLTDRQLQANK